MSTTKDEDGSEAVQLQQDVTLRDATTIHILRPADLTREQQDHFWSEGVCMDDWDYMVVAPLDMIEPINEDGSGEAWHPNSYTLERLLDGVCSNEWYRAEVNGEDRAVGVAYHA